MNMNFAHTASLACPARSAGAGELGGFAEAEVTAERMELSKALPTVGWHHPEVVALSPHGRDPHPETGHRPARQLAHCTYSRAASRRA
jgi:hypothetical protein